MLSDRLQQDNYVFTDGDLSLINEMQAPKQEMNIEERPNFESPDMPDSFVPDPDDEKNDNLVSAAVEETADFIVDAIDLGASFGLHMISKAPIEEHQASDEQKSKIRQIVYVYCKETGGYIPLWLQFLLLIVGIYGMQIPTALSMRKINELEEQNKKLQEEIQKLNLQKESQRLKEELKEVENAESAK
jgi:hypothetical protein